MAFASFTFGQTLASPVNVTSTGVRSYTHSATLLKNAVVTNYYMTSAAFETMRLQIDLDTVAAGALSVATVVYGSLDKVNWEVLTGNVTGETLTRSAATGAIATTFNADSTITGTYVPINYTTTLNGTTTITTAGTHAATSSVMFEKVNYNYIKIVTTAANQTQYALLRYKILFVKYD